MIKYWEIRAMPSPEDESRHCLYLDGDTIDVDMLLMKLGNICSRPLMAEPPYTYALYLYDTNEEILLKSERVVADIVRRSQRRKGRKAELAPDNFGKLQNPASEFTPSSETIVERDALYAPPETLYTAFAEPEPVRRGKPGARPGRRPSRDTPREKTKDSSRPEMPAEPAVSFKPELAPAVQEEVEALERGRKGMIKELRFTVIPEVPPNPAAPPPRPALRPAGPVPPRAMQPAGPAKAEPDASDRLMPAPPRVPVKPTIRQVSPPPQQRPPVQTVRQAAPAPQQQRPPAQTVRQAAPAPQPVNPTQPSGPADMMDMFNSGNLRMTASSLRLTSSSAGPVKQGAAVPAKAKAVAGKREPWTVDAPLNPIFTAERLIPSVNRFAHAAALSTIDSPGSMYNPLFMHGVAGSGKTHFLSAVAYGIGAKKGADKVFVTDGTRFSRGVHQMILRNTVADFEAKLMGMEAICIDDIHLMALGEENRRYIAGWLAEFKKARKQIVVTSSVSGPAVRELETRLGFEFSSSKSAVELKAPAEEQKREVVREMVSWLDANIAEEEQDSYLVRRDSNLSAVLRSMLRLKAMETIVPAHNPPLTTVNMLDIIFGGASEAEGDPNDAELKKVQNFTPKGTGGWGKWGFFGPMGQDRYLDWVMASITERAKELGLAGSFVPAARMEYDPSMLAASAFKIAEECDSKDLYGAVVLGVPGSDSQKMAVFSESLRHMLGSLSVRLAWFDREKLRAPSSYVRVLLDLLG
ncbi:MAG: DnaA/Hda family protein [Elusimicrobiaceae bacterium]|nr:DnaA/Hda family protein [Elusimicrobiaceae bacterium]